MYRRGHIHRIELRVWCLGVRLSQEAAVRQGLRRVMRVAFDAIIDPVPCGSSGCESMKDGFWAFGSRVWGDSCAKKTTLNFEALSYEYCGYSVS